MKKLSFRVRKAYFDLIMAGKKRTEYRRYIPFWLIRISEYGTTGMPVGSRWRTDPGEFQAVFICGKRIHRREIVAISRIHTPVFSAQGKKDVDTETCLAFELGSEIK